MTRKTIRFSQVRRLAVGAFVSLGACVWLSADAQAITIGIGSTADNTVVTLTGGGSGDRAQGRSLAVTNAGGFAADAVSANVTAATRFAATVAADRAAATSGSTATAQDAVDYTVNFTVTPDFLTSTYMVDINTSILGAATARDDGSGASGSGTATMTNVAGSLNAIGNASLTLVSNATRNGTSNTTGVETQFSGSNLLSIGPFSGVQNFALRFTFTLRATSPQSLLGGDEQAVRMGISDPLGGSNADNYPGAPPRVVADDGHFVTVKATVLTVVPEPSTVVLAGMAGIGLGLVVWRRRKQ